MMILSYVSLKRPKFIRPPNNRPCFFLCLQERSSLDFIPRLGYIMKTAFKFDLVLLKTIIENCEQEKIYSTHSALFQDVALKYNQQKSGGKDINGPLVGLRVKELGIELKTVKGKRGRAPGEKIGGVKVPREQKFAASPQITKHFAAAERILKADKMYAKYGGLLEKAKKGSVNAAIRLGCLFCSNYQPLEIKECAAIGVCPVWHLRPNKSDNDNGVEDNEDQKCESREL